MEKSRNLLMKGWREDGSIWENYNAITGNGWERSSSSEYQNSDPFYHWGALLVLIDFIENGYLDPVK